MLPSISQLTELLREERLLYETLTESIRREQQLIQSFDTRGLAAAIGRKEALNRSILALEQRRVTVTAALAREIGCAPRQLNVSLLLPHLEPREQRELIDSKEQLLAAIATAQSEARRLEMQFRATIGIFEDTMRFVAGELSDQQPEQAYTRRGGAAAGRRSAGSVIVSTRA